MVTMFVFLLPLIVAQAILGLTVGWVVGRKWWGKFGAILLSLTLGLTPALAGLGVGMYLLHRAVW
jgi:hypothetical protein